MTGYILAREQIHPAPLGFPNLPLEMETCPLFPMPITPSSTVFEWDYGGEGRGLEGKEGLKGYKSTVIFLRVFSN